MSLNEVIKDLLKILSILAIVLLGIHVANIFLVAGSGAALLSGIIAATIFGVVYAVIDKEKDEGVDEDVQSLRSFSE